MKEAKWGQTKKNIVTDLKLKLPALLRSWRTSMKWKVQKQRLWRVRVDSKTFRRDCRRRCCRSSTSPESRRSWTGRLKIIIIIITQMLKKGFCTHWTTNLKWNTTHKYIYYSYFYSWQLLGRKSSIEFALLTHYLIILSATIILHYKLQTIMIFYDVRKCLNHSWNLRLKKRKTKNEI